MQNEKGNPGNNCKSVNEPLIMLIISTLHWEDATQKDAFRTGTAVYLKFPTDTPISSLIQIA